MWPPSAGSNDSSPSSAPVLEPSRLVEQARGPSGRCDVALLLEDLDGFRGGLPRLAGTARNAQYLRQRQENLSLEIQGVGRYRACGEVAQQALSLLGRTLPCEEARPHAGPG